MTPSPTRRRLRRGLLWLLGAGSLAVLGIGGYVTAVYLQTPSLGELRAMQSAQPSVMLSREGQTLTSFRRDQQEPVPLDRISPRVVEALIATEDHRFFEHKGVDVYRTLGAVVHTLQGDTQGGSTITQQLARNLFPEEIGRARSVHRKLKELFTAMRMERVYSKQQIVETYLNTVPFLYNVVGIEMAARTYCDKSAAELDTLEAATLVGMLKGTHYYNPVRFPERARERRNVVLAQMAKQDLLTRDEVERLSQAPLRVQFSRESESLGMAPHFAAHARRWLIDWAEANGHDLYADGLVIHTTLDAGLQQAATRAVEEQTLALQRVADVEWSAASLPVASRSIAAYAAAHPRVEPFAHWWRQRPRLLEAALRDSPPYRQLVEQGTAPDDALRQVAAKPEWLAAAKARKTRLEAGLVAIDPATGEVRVWVGSRDFAQDQYDHVARAQRQPGSTFKPFVYGAALEAGIGPLRTYVDAPVEVPLGGGKTWKPTDMQGFSGLPMSLRDGLVHSKNTITAQVMQEVGISRVATLAQAMGVNLSKLDAVPSLALGTSPVTLLEMTSAYATIARQGTHHPPIFVSKITDRHGHTLASFGGKSQRAMSPGSAIELTDMMRGVVQRGTGTQGRSRFGIVADIAGKTGTTQNNTDGWFILMHPQLVVGAWVGFNDSRVTMRSNHWGQGGHNAVLLVGDFFGDALKSKAVDANATFPQSSLSPTRRFDAPQPEDWVDADPAGELPLPHEPPNAVPGDEPAGTTDPMEMAQGNADPAQAQARVELDRLLERLATSNGGGAAPAAGGVSVRPTAAPVNAPVDEGAIAAPLRVWVREGLK